MQTDSLKIFVRLHRKDWSKVKDLNDNSPLRLKQTASHSHDHTAPIVGGGKGGGHPVRPYLDPPLPCHANSPWPLGMSKESTCKNKRYRVIFPESSLSVP